MVNQALLFAWPTNNYWNTNFRASQPGMLRFRYELKYHARFDAAASSRFAAAAARPVMFHPVVSLEAAPPAGTLLAGLPDMVSIVSLKSSGPDSLTLVLRNHAAEACMVQPTLPGRTVRSIDITDLLGDTFHRVDADVSTRISARSTLALHIEFDAWVGDANGVEIRRAGPDLEEVSHPDYAYSFAR